MVEQNTISGAPGSSTGGTQGTDYFAYDDCREYLMPNNAYLVRNLRTGSYGMISAEVLNAMHECRTFRNMNEHVAHLAKTIPALRGQQANIRAVLDSVRKDGLTVTARELGSRLQAIPDAKARTDLPVVAIMTCDRPTRLERLLGSIAGNHSGWRQQRCYVIDDSRSSESGAANRATVEGFRARGWEALEYLGAEELRGIMSDLIRALPDDERGIRFLLDRAKWADQHSCGLARNFGLLVSIGQRLLLIDDDLLCEVYEPHGQSTAVTLGSAQREADFLADISEYDRYRSTGGLSAIDRHAQALGMNLGDALGLLQLSPVTGASMAGKRPDSVTTMTSDSPVLISACGYLGDPGTGSNNWLAKITETSRERLLQSAEKLQSAITHRQVWMGREQVHVQPELNMSGMTGIDNRDSIPPYFPVFRWEDALFGKMTHFVNPGSVCLEYPFAIPHVPEEDRGSSIEKTSFALPYGFPKFFLDYIEWQRESCFSEQARDRLEFLADCIDALGRRPAAALIELYRDSAVSIQALHTQTLIDILGETRNAPEPWTRLIRDAIAQANADIITATTETRIEGVPAGLAGEELIAYWQRAFRDFAAALHSWPRIRQAAAEIMDKR